MHACMQACQLTCATVACHVTVRKQQKQHRKPPHKVAVGLHFERPIYCPARSPMKISTNLLENVVCDIVLRLARDDLCSSHFAFEC